MKSRIITAALLALVAISLSACVSRVKSGTDTYADTGTTSTQAQPAVAVAEPAKTR